MVINKTKVSSATKIRAVILYFKGQGEGPARPACATSVSVLCRGVLSIASSPFSFSDSHKMNCVNVFKAITSYLTLWTPYMIPNSAKLFCKSETYTMKYTTKNTVINREECSFICGKKGLNLSADKSQILWLLLRCSAGCSVQPTLSLNSRAHSWQHLPRSTDRVSICWERTGCLTSWIDCRSYECSILLLWKLLNFVIYFIHLWYIIYLKNNSIVCCWNGKN